MTTVVVTQAKDRETWYLLKISRTFVRKLSNFKIQKGRSCMMGSSCRGTKDDYSGSHTS